MIKKTITYTDYNDNERTEDFYFNLSKAEIMKMQLSEEGGMDAMIQKIIAAQDVPSLINMFEAIILKAYGEKSADGKRFIKTKELADAFIQTEAYSNLYMELVSDTDAATAFINGVIPNDIDASKVPSIAVADN